MNVRQFSRDSYMNSFPLWSFYEDRFIFLPQMTDPGLTSNKSLTFCLGFIEEQGGGGGW